MDNATRCAKQEITEAAKFLTWLLAEYDTTIDDLTQGQLDTYLSDGTTTRTAIRNFIQWRARAGIAPPFKTRYRVARTAPPLASTRQHLDLIKHVIEADHVLLSTRIAALLLMLFGTPPLDHICRLTIDDVVTTPTRTTIALGAVPAPPIPPALLPPLFHQHLEQRANSRTMNTAPPLGCFRDTLQDNIYRSNHSCTDCAVWGGSTSRPHATQHCMTSPKKSTQPHWLTYSATPPKS